MVPWTSTTGLSGAEAPVVSDIPDFEYLVDELRVV
jgi:hypothetical protein